MSPIDALKEAIRLHKENPNSKILFWVSNDETCDPMDFAFTAQEPVRVEALRGCWDSAGDGRWMTEDEALDEFADDNDNASEEEIRAMFDRVAVNVVAIWLGARAAR
jgi:hypothetical protein